MSQGSVINIGISACLAGKTVRYDGSSNYVADLYEYLHNLFNLVTVCPEVAIGMGVPRAPIQLVGTPATARAQGVQMQSMDVTDKLIAFSEQTMNSEPVLDGFVVKARSPSCGLETTPIFNNHKEQIATGSGIFTHTLINLRPGLPVIDESAISNLEKMDIFVLQVCVYSAFRQQVLMVEDRQVAMEMFKQNIKRMAGAELDNQLNVSTQLAKSTFREEQCIQYICHLIEQLSRSDMASQIISQLAASGSRRSCSKRVSELMGSLSTKRE